MINQYNIIFQSGNRHQVGLNGLYLEEVLLQTINHVKKLNEKQPCKENSLVITKLEEALLWQEAQMKRVICEAGKK